MVSRSDKGLFFIRLMLGVVFVFHGSQKLFGWFGGPGIDGFAGFLGTLHVPMPMVSAYLAALAEFVGGLALITSIAFRLMLIPMIINMLVAIVTVHMANGFDMQQHGMEYPLTLAVILIALGYTGPGAVNLGNMSSLCCCSGGGCGTGGGSCGSGKK